MKSILLFGTLCVASILSACNKNSFITGPEAVVSTSEDMLQFDTLFTTAGSVTHSFKIFNENNQKVRLSSIALNGGTSSPFRINADGRQGPVVENVEMEAYDSLYVFVTVQIDPSTENLPFVVRDSINITYNGIEKGVQLRAWGQNARFLEGVVLTENSTWTNELPIVILGGLVVDQGTTLTIEAGTNIFLHADSPIFIEGTLITMGEKYDSTRVVFQGDRLDEPYRNYPGSWPGLYFRGASQNSVLEHTIVKNAYQGLVAEEPSNNQNPKLTLRNCIIDNCFDAGILGVQSEISGENCLVSNSGKNIVLAGGGRYSFTHTTVVSVSNDYIQHKEPVLRLTNFVRQNNTLLVGDLFAEFANCIFWGENGIVDNEVVTSREEGAIFNADFRHCLWKNTSEPEFVTSASVIANEDPLFVDIDTRNRHYDFRLQEGSPARNSGLPLDIQVDLDGNPRDPLNPDLGAFESTF